MDMHMLFPKQTSLKAQTHLKPYFPNSVVSSLLYHASIYKNEFYLDVYTILNGI